MQGIEFILWNHQTCDDFHKNVSILGQLLNSSQPAVLGIIILALSSRQTYRKIIIGIIITYILGSVLWENIKPKISHCTNPRPNDPHLVWNWTSGQYHELSWIGYLITAMSICILGMPTINIGFLCALFYCLTMLISVLVYKRDSVGSMWCFFIAFLPIVYFIVRTMFIKLA